MKHQSLCSIIIPVAPYHETRAAEAIASARQQTAPCEVLIEHDTQRTGAAATRNRALSRATGAFIVFLDADDTLDPKFVESCLEVWQRGGYVYTRERINGVLTDMPTCEHWHPLRVYHYVTTFMPRAMAGDGFDTNAPIEDMDFYLRARFEGWRPIFLDRALWDYRRDYGKSDTNPNDTRHVERLKAAEQWFKQRYERYSIMGCCGKPVLNPTSDMQAGDVQAQALYSPRRVRGIATGRVYPRPNPQGQLWVDPRDATAMPDMFRIMHDIEAFSPDIATVTALAQSALANDDEGTVIETPKPARKRK